MSQPARLELVMDILRAHGVEFIVVGGQAEWIFGSPRVTFDIDICYRRTKPNLERLAAALRQMKPTLRNAPPDLPFIIDAQSLEMGDNFTFSTEFGDFDLLGYLEPIGTYEELLPRIETHQIDGKPVQVIALDDLIRIKQHIHRPKDRDSLFQLQAIKAMREELKNPPG